MKRIENIDRLLQLERCLQQLIDFESDTVKWLELCNNRLDFICNVFGTKYAHLTILLINNCCLQSIQCDAFVDLVNLLELDLQRNCLRSLADSLFDRNRKLKILNVSKNSLTTFRCRWLRHLTELEVLRVADNDLTVFEQVFSRTVIELDLHGNCLFRFEFVYMPNLQRLDLDCNRLPKLESSRGIFFTRAITELTLTANPIETLDPYLFVAAVHLTALSLCNCSLTDFAANQFAELRSLTILCVCWNKIRVVRNRWFDACHALETLSFDANEIDDIEPDAFVKLKQLKQFHLSWNRSRVTPKDDDDDGRPQPFVVRKQWFRKNYQLESLHFAKAKITQIETGSFVNLRRLRLLDLSYNYLTSLPARWLADDRPLDMNVLLLDNNRLVADTAPFRFPVAVTGRIYFVSLSKTFVSAIDRFSFDDALTIEHLALVDCKLSATTFQFDFGLIRGLKILNLSSNCFRAYDYCRAKPHTMIVGRVHGYEPARFFARPLVGPAAVNQLDELLLANCRIDYVPRYFFDNLIHLTILDLCANRLIVLDGCLRPLVELVKLNLSANLLENFVVNPFKENRKLSRLDLADNKHLTVLKSSFVKTIAVVYVDDTCVLV